MRNKPMKKYLLNKYYSSIIKAFFALIVLIGFSNHLILAQAPDAFYNWASGYKFRTNPANDGTMDKENYFKNVGLEPGTWEFSNYVNMTARFPVSQENWTTSYPACRSGQLSAANCTYDGQIITDDVTFTYTCTGDVSYVMQDDNSSKDLVGGDTMYGTWSMLFNFMPPVDPTDCGADERPFVGNAFIVDTKAQKEANAGLLPGLGIKELVDSPGEVYYFDQVRALTQPPGENFDSYNNMVLVGSAIPGMESLTGCDPALFEKLFGKNSPFSVGNIPQAAKDEFKNVMLPQLKKSKKLMEAYGVGSKYKIPCEILAGIHYVECNAESDWSTCSLWAGGGALQGGSLKSDAEKTAQELQGNLFGKNDFWSYVASITYHNGTGNLNCNTSITSGGVTCPVGPTDWKANGWCPPRMWDDSPYALAWIDAKHYPMQLVFENDFGGNCANLFNPPKDKEGPGVFAIAYLLHEYLKGASTASASCVSQY
jgi:hypothetical protein